MTEYFPPLVIPPRRALIHPMRRPFNVDKDCVLCLLPEINSTWIDYSDESNDAALTAVSTSDSGRHGPALSFDGVNDVITVTHSASIADFTALTVEIWMYPTNIGGTGTTLLFINKGAGGTGGHRFWISSTTTGQVSFKLKNSVDTLKSEENDLLTPANKWYHVVGTWDGSYITVYVNAVPGTSTAFSGTLNDTSNLQIGSTSNDYAGLMDEIRYYRRGLTQWEITALYEAGRPT